MDNRKCKNCGNESKVDEFPLAGTINGKKYYRHLCTSCYSGTKKKRKDMLREWFNEYKNDLKCIKCGIDDFRVIEFHHVDPTSKDFNLGDAIKGGFSKDRILKEIDKCDVVCSNCHKIIHYELKYGNVV